MATKKSTPVGDAIKSTDAVITTITPVIPTLTPEEKKAKEDEVSTLFKAAQERNALEEAIANDIDLALEMAQWTLPEVIAILKDTVERSTSNHKDELISLTNQLERVAFR